MWLQNHMQFFLLISLFILILVLSVLGLCVSCAGFLWLPQIGASHCYGVQSSHYGGFSCCCAPIPGVQASAVAAPGLQSQGSVLWHMSLVAPCHMGSPWTKDQTMSHALVGEFLTARKPGKSETHAVLRKHRKIACSFCPVSHSGSIMQICGKSPCGALMLIQSQYRAFL